jgi:hypothetical protein
MTGGDPVHDDERERGDERPQDGPGRHADPHDAGDPLTEEGGTETGTSSGAPGEHEEPDAGGPNPSPRREQPGL